MTEIDSNSNRWLKLYQSWIVAAKNIKNDDTLVDNANISELLDIENEIWSLALEFKEAGIELPESMAQFKSYVDLYNEICSELKNELSSTESDSIDESDKKVTRPIDPKIATNRKNLNIRYYELKDTRGLTKKKCLEILAAEFPQWTISTIETYLKK